MKILNVSNSLDNTVLKYAKELANKQFKHFNDEVNMFQSTSHTAIKEIDGGSIYACTLNGEDFETAINCFGWLDEVTDVDVKAKYTIWLEKGIATNPKMTEVIIHELRHVEQQISDAVTFKKAQAIDILSSLALKVSDLHIESPIELDASLFQKSVAYSYDWITETKYLFGKYKSNLNEILNLYKNEDQKTIYVGNHPLFINPYEKDYINYREWIIHIIEKVKALT